MDQSEESQTVRGRLDEIVECGAPALAREAQLLGDEWAARPGDRAVAEQAALLFDAYLNDPYLTRYSDPAS